MLSIPLQKTKEGSKSIQLPFHSQLQKFREEKQKKIHMESNVFKGPPWSDHSLT